MKNFKQTIFATMMLAMVMLVLGGAQAFAAILTVDDTTTEAIPGGAPASNNGGDCPTATFRSIQAAVTASVSGDTINVCPGEYPEQVVINKNLTLQGVSVNNKSRPRITGPLGAFTTASDITSGTVVEAYILVTPGIFGPLNNVNVFNLTVDGDSNGDGAAGANGSSVTQARRVGIFYLNAAGSIQANAVKAIISTDTPSFPPVTTSDEGGVGIMVSNNDAMSRTTTVNNNVVVNFEKTGISLTRTGTNATVAGNFIFGLGVNALASIRGPLGEGQVGIAINNGAIVNANTNRIGELLDAGCTIRTPNCNTVGVGIFVSDNTQAQRLVSNNITRVNRGLTVFTSNSDISSNIIAAVIGGDGMLIIGNGNTVNSNTIRNVDGMSLGSGIRFINSSGNTLTSNTFNDARIGISGTTGNTLVGSGNSFRNVDINTTTTQQ